MKTPNYIMELANRQFDDELNRYSFLKEEDRERQVDTNVKRLMKIRKALLAGRMYFRVKSVSKSGMSRTIEAAFIEQNNLFSIYEPFLLQLMGCDKNGRINGCGMDMLFSAQYNLFRSLCPNHRYQDSMPRYRTM